MVLHAQRTIGNYDPVSDAARHHGWRIQQTDLFGIGEVFNVEKRVILLDNSFRTREALAHAVAHLDLGHLEGRLAGSFTEEQEQQADFLAAVRLDVEGSRR